MGLHDSPTPVFLEHCNEEVAVGDAVFVERKGKTIEASVVVRQGLRIRIMPEDRSGDIWVAVEECKKVVPGGAEELEGRAARIAAEKARLEAIRKAEEDRKAGEKAEKTAYEKVIADRESRIASKLAARAVPSRDWLPVGVHCWTESPVLMDQTKDLYRLIWYEINTELDYGAKHAPPEIDLSEVDQLKESFELRDKEEVAKKKEAAKKKRPPKPTPEQLEEEEAAKKAQEEADAAAIEEAKKRAEEILQEKLKEFEAAEKTRTPVKPPKYPPDLPAEVEPPQHPKNQELYEKILSMGHGGDRVFYTDGTMHSIPYVVGSNDGACKGGGLAKEVAEMMGFQEKITYFTDAYDGGRTLTKHDCYPPEDPAVWVRKETELWSGEFREDAPGTEDW